VTDYHINIFFSDEDGGYVADIPDLEFCSAFGETPEKALAELEIARKAWIKAARAAENRFQPPDAGPRSIRRSGNRVARQLKKPFDILFRQSPLIST